MSFNNNNTVSFASPKKNATTTKKISYKKSTILEIDGRGGDSLNSINIKFGKLGIPARTRSAPPQLADQISSKALPKVLPIDEEAESFPVEVVMSHAAPNDAHPPFIPYQANPVRSFSNFKYQQQGFAPPPFIPQQYFRPPGYISTEPKIKIDLTPKKNKALTFINPNTGKAVELPKVPTQPSTPRKTDDSKASEGKEPVPAPTKNPLFNISFRKDREAVQAPQTKPIVQPPSVNASPEKPKAPQPTKPAVYKPAMKPVESEKLVHPPLTNGKIVYSINYLMEFRSKCQTKPIGLNIDIIDRSMTKSKSQSFDRRSSSTQSYRGSRQNSQRGYRNDSRESRRSQTPAPYVQYVPSENRWQPAKSLEHDEKVVRDVQLILNKITFDTFDILMKEMLDAGISNQNILEKVIDVIFAKAVDEPGFADIYARVCYDLSSNLRIDTDVDIANSRQSAFRRGLLRKCQQLFEQKTWMSEETEEKPEGSETILPGGLTDTDYERIKAKRRFLGNISFSGEMFKIGVLSDKVMHTCCRKLLHDLETPEEEEMESLCRLLKTVGRQMDTPESASVLDVYFGRMTILSKNPTLSSRIKFMLKDVIDLRKNRWEGIVSRSESVNSFNSRKSDRRDLRRDSRRSEKGEERKMKIGVSKLKPLAQPRSQSEGEWKVASSRQSSTTSLNEKSPRGSPISSTSNSFVALSDGPETKVTEILSKPDPKVISKKIQATLDEFFSSGDVQEAVLDFKEKFRPNAHSLVVQSMIEIVLEKNKKLVLEVCRFQSALFEQNEIASPDLVTGFREAFVYLEDFCVDAPLAFDFAGILLGNAAVHEMITGQLLCTEVLETHLKEKSNKLVKLFGELFKFIRMERDCMAARAFCESMPISLKDLSESESWLENNSLFFLSDSWADQLQSKIESDAQSAISFLDSHFDESVMDKDFVEKVSFMILNSVSKALSEFDKPSFFAEMEKYSGILRLILGEDTDLQVHLLHSIAKFEACKSRKEFFTLAFTSFMHNKVLDYEPYLLWAQSEPAELEFMQTWISWLENEIKNSD